MHESHATEKTREAQLEDLICSLFSSADELSRLIARHQSLAHLNREIPQGALALVTHHFVNVLSKHGLVDKTFFLALLEARPRSHREIAKMAQRWGIDVTSIEEIAHYSVVRTRLRNAVAVAVATLAATTIAVYKCDFSFWDPLPRLLEQPETPTPPQPSILPDGLADELSVAHGQSARAATTSTIQCETVPGRDKRAPGYKLNRELTLVTDSIRANDRTLEVNFTVWNHHVSEIAKISAITLDEVDRIAGWQLWCPKCPRSTLNFFLNDRRSILPKENETYELPAVSSHSFTAILHSAGESVTNARVFHGLAVYYSTPSSNLTEVRSEVLYTSNNGIFTCDSIDGAALHVRPTGHVFPDFTRSGEALRTWFPCEWTGEYLPPTRPELEDVQWFTDAPKTYPPLAKATSTDRQLRVIVNRVALFDRRKFEAATKTSDALSCDTQYVLDKNDGVIIGMNLTYSTPDDGTHLGPYWSLKSSDGRALVPPELYENRHSFDYSRINNLWLGEEEGRVVGLLSRTPEKYSIQRGEQFVQTIFFMPIRQERLNNIILNYEYGDTQISFELSLERLRSNSRTSIRPRLKP